MTETGPHHHRHGAPATGEPRRARLSGNGPQPSRSRTPAPRNRPDSRTRQSRQRDLLSDEEHKPRSTLPGRKLPGQTMAAASTHPHPALRPASAAWLCLTGKARRHTSFTMVLRLSVPWLSGSMALHGAKAFPLLRGNHRSCPAGQVCAEDNRPMRPANHEAAATS